jgi:WD40 repeat protein
VALALQNGLHQFARPWNRLRALRVFRDAASLSANPGLWASIQHALQDTAFLLLLASPRAAGSVWVGREVAFWCALGRRPQLLIALTEGEIYWDEATGDFDWSRTNALPPTLRNQFSEEPLYIDLRWTRGAAQMSMRDPRFRDTVADLAAPMHGRLKDDLIGEDIRQQRRFVRFRRTVFAGLAALATGLAVATVAAVQQRDEAIRERNVALARQLAAQARLLEATAADDATTELAAALAVESWRRFPNAAASGAAARLTRELPFARMDQGGAVNSIAFSGNGTTLATGSADGSARLYDATTAAERLRVPHDRPVSLVALDAEATRLVTASGSAIRLLDPQGGGDLVPPITMEGVVSSIALSADGTRLAAVTANGGLRLIATETGKDVLAPVTLGAKSCCVAIAPDGRWLAAAAGERVRLIGITPAENPTIEPLERMGAVTTLALSRDGTRLAVGSVTGVARLIDVASGQDLAPPLLHGAALRRVAFSPDGTRLATASLAGIARLLDTANGRQIAEITHGGAVLSVDFSHDSALLATASTDHTVRVIDAVTGQEQSRIAHGDVVFKVAFNPHGGALATGTFKYEHALRLFDPADGTEHGRFTRAKPVNSVSLSADGRLIAIASADGIATLSRVSDLRELLRVKATSGITQALLSRDGRLLALVMEDGAVEIRPTEAEGAAAPVVRVQGDAPVRAVDFSPDGNLLAIGGDDGVLRLIDPDTGRDARPPQARDGAIVAVRVSYDGSWLATAGRDGAVSLASVGDHAPPAVFRTGGAVNAIDFSPDSRFLGVAGEDGSARLIDVASRREVQRIVHQGKVLGLAFGPDGTLLATGGEDHRVHLLSVATGREMRAPMDEGQPVNNLAFSPDGRFLATVNDSGIAQVFATATGDEVARFQRPGPVTGVTYTADSRLLAVSSGEGDNQVNLFWADPQRAIDTLCARVGRNLGPYEWASYIGPGEARRETCPGWR